MPFLGPLASGKERERWPAFLGLLDAAIRVGTRLREGCLDAAEG